MGEPLIGLCNAIGLVRQFVRLGDCSFEWVFDVVCGWVIYLILINSLLRWRIIYLGCPLRYTSMMYFIVDVASYGILFILVRDLLFVLLLLWWRLTCVIIMMDRSPVHVP